MICKFSLWSLHIIISIIKWHSWYKKLPLLSNVTSYYANLTLMKMNVLWTMFHLSTFTFSSLPLFLQTQQPSRQVYCEPCFMYPLSVHCLCIFKSISHGDRCLIYLLSLSIHCLCLYKSISHDNRFIVNNVSCIYFQFIACVYSDPAAMETDVLRDKCDARNVCRIWCHTT